MGLRPVIVFYCVKMSEPQGVEPQDVEVSKEKKDPVDLYLKEFEKLFSITEKILDKLDRKDRICGDFRLFKIVYTNFGIGHVSAELREMRTNILISWTEKKNFEDLLEKFEILQINQYVPKANMKGRPQLHIGKILSIAKTRSVLDSSDDQTVKYYPQIFSLHVARILNMIDNDERLIKEIRKYEKLLRSGSDSVDQVEAPTFAGFSLASVPEQYRGMAQQFAPHMEGMMKMIPGLINGGVLNDFTSGNFKGAAKKASKNLKKNPDFLKSISGMSDMVNPALKGASAFLGKDFLPAGLGDNLNLESLIEKATAELDKEDDGDEEPVASSADNGSNQAMEDLGKAVMDKMKELVVPTLQDAMKKLSTTDHTFISMGVEDEDGKYIELAKNEADAEPEVAPVSSEDLRSDDLKSGDLKSDD